MRDISWKDSRIQGAKDSRVCFPTSFILNLNIFTKSYKSLVSGQIENNFLRLGILPILDVFKNLAQMIINRHSTLLNLISFHSNP